MIIFGVSIPLTWGAVHAILAALTFFGGSIFWVLYNIHTRLTDIEERGGKRRAAIFGSENNPLHVGLTKEVASLKQDIDELKVDSDDSKQEREELKRRLTRVEEQLERVLKQLDD